MRPKNFEVGLAFLFNHLNCQHLLLLLLGNSVEEKEACLKNLQDWKREYQRYVINLTSDNWE
jgi:hypothetical protein